MLNSQVKESNENDLYLYEQWALKKLRHGEWTSKKNKIFLKSLQKYLTSNPQGNFM